MKDTEVTYTQDSQGWCDEHAISRSECGCSFGPFDSDPIPLRQKPAVPEFPVDALPSVLQRYVLAIAEATQTPVDMAAMIALGTASASVAGRVTVRIKVDWSVGTNLYVIVAMDPGNRKSSVLESARRPLDDLERELMDEMSPVIQTARAKKEFRESAAASLKKKKSANAGAEYEQAVLDANSIEVPSMPKLFIEDATPEAIVVAADEQDGRIAVSSDEGGGILAIFAGRYSNGQKNLEVVLKGWDSRSYRVNRVGREARIIDSLTLTFLLTLQPGVLKLNAEEDEEASRGYLERFLYSMPKSYVGWRKTNPEPVPEDVEEDYYGLVYELGKKYFPKSSAVELTLDEEALQVSNEIAEKHEVWARPDGYLGKGLLRGWGSKLHGRIAAIAGVLHMSEDDGTGPISADTFRRADRIGDYLAAHAVAAFAHMDSTPPHAKAEVVLEVVAENQLEEFSVRDLMRKLHGRSKGGFDRASTYDEPIETLVAFGWITQLETGEQNRGRPRNPKYVPHPSVFTRMATVTA